MTVYANKPAFNVREKLKELDYARVPYHKMPAGSVIQTKAYKQNSGWISTTSTAEVFTGVEFAIYPKRKNSLILVEFHFPMTHTYSDTMIPTLRRKVDGETQIDLNTTSYHNGYIQGATTSAYQSIMITEHDYPDTTNRVNYEVYFKSAGGGAVHLAHNGSAYRLKLTEIAQ
jgi:hemin uptake protein HemP